jgi:hypothetical protein
MSISSQVLYGLECDHAAPGPATLVSGSLYCAWHQDERNIVSVIEYEWKAKCNNCTYSRWAGLSKKNAAIFLDGHLSRNPAHVGHLEYARNPVASETARKMQAWKGKATG